MKLSKKIILLGLTLSVLFVCSCKTNEVKSSPVAENPVGKYDVVADAVTKQGPIKVADGIQMDKVEYNKSSHSLKYIYTFTKMAKSDNSEATWKLIEAVTRETLVAEFKSQPAIGQFRNDKLNLIFVCNDKNNVHLFTVMLKHGEY